MKEKIDDSTYSFRCYFDNDNEDFIQINVIDANIDSAIIFKRYDTANA